ncbi:MAG: DNA-3-methyladenine glycosylase family protein [Anaerocolumna sp.]
MIITQENFNLKQIALSGQCFRMNEIGENYYSVIAFGRYIELKQIEEDQIEFSCDLEEFNEVWRDYFDLDYDYKEVVTKLLEGKDEFLKNAAGFGEGLRILKQDFFEMLITFIISQRKNIPAIKKSIELLCEKYGEKKYTTMDSAKVYYTFPSPHTLANASLSDLRETGLGYRDVYVKNSSNAILDNNIDLVHLKKASYEEAIKQLLELSGVGIKVANCIALFGLHHIEAFPVDVWIERILKEIYNNTFDVHSYDGYAGIVQQYMFYYIRYHYERNVLS